MASVVFDAGGIRSRRLDQKQVSHPRWERLTQVTRGLARLWGVNAVGFVPLRTSKARFDQGRELVLR